MAAHPIKEDHGRNSGAAQLTAPHDGIHPESPEVMEQLERILTSAEFVGSDRTRRFLRYVVEETLAGRGNRIKAYSVAIAAFDRDDSFDPQNDPIVRIEAARLRRSLERYYLIAGAATSARAAASVRIEIPRGGYVPIFSWVDAQAPDKPAGMCEPANVPDQPNESPPASAPPHRLVRLREWIFSLAAVLALIVAGIAILTDLSIRDEPVDAVRPALPRPSVAVLEFSIFDDEQQITRLPTGITNEVVRELSRYSSVFIVGPQALQRFGAAPDVTLIGRDAGVDFVLSGKILVFGKKFQVSVNLSDTRTGGIIWAETYERAFVIDRLFDLEVEIARTIVRQIGQPQGAIATFDWKRTRGMAPESWEAYDCVVQADELHRRIAPPEEMREVLSCLETVTTEEPGYAEAWALLALIEIDAVRFEPVIRLSTGGPERAFAAAARAVDLAPDSGRAHLAVMSALTFQGKIEAALAAGQTAVRLSPHDPDLLAEVGLRNIVSGDARAGMRFLEQAVSYSPAVPASYQLSLSLGYLLEGAYQKALDTIAGLPPSSNFVHCAIVAAVHGKAGKLDTAREAADELLRVYPDFADWAWLELERRSMTPALAAAMVEGWRAAGLEIPPSSRGGKAH